MNSTNIIFILNDLIQSCRDGQEAIRMCLAGIGDRSTREILMEREAAFAARADELQDLVLARGGTPETGGSVGGGLRREWFNVKIAILGVNDDAWVIESERFQDAALRCYRKALNKELPNNVRTIVKRQFGGLLRLAAQTESV